MVEAFTLSSEGIVSKKSDASKLGLALSSFNSHGKHSGLLVRDVI
jgi:hypothetical protein